MPRCEDDLSRCEGEKDVQMKRYVQKRREVEAEFVTHPHLSHTHTHTLAFTPRPLKYTQNPLHTDAVTHRHVLDIFTHEGLYR